MKHNVITLRIFLLYIVVHGISGYRKQSWTLFQESYVSDFYNMGNLRVFTYELPDSTEVCHWCFRSWNKQHSSDCPVRETVVYIQSGSLPTPPYQGVKSLPEFLAMQDVSFANASFMTNGSVYCITLSNPISATWFGTAHLSKDQHKEKVTPLNSVDCSYIIQANITSYSLTSVSVITVDYPMSFSLNSGMSQFRFLISDNAQNYVMTIHCVHKCTLNLSVRAGGLPLHHSANISHQVSANCSDSHFCQLKFVSPVIDTWHYLNIANLQNVSVPVELYFNLSVCQSVQVCHNGTSCNSSALPEVLSNSTAPSWTFVTNTADVTTPFLPTVTSMSNAVTTQPVPPPMTSCTDNVILMLRQENPAAAFDVSSSLFYVLYDDAVYISRFNVDPLKDTGGTLSVVVRLRQLSTSASPKMSGSEVEVVQLCVQSASLPYAQDSQLKCSSSIDILSASTPQLQKLFLYPQPGPWFIAVKSNCSAVGSSDVSQSQKCSRILAVSVVVSIGSCVNDGCQNGGECRGYVKGIYTYAACNCIAGYGGYACEDDSNAQSEAMQQLYTCLLTLTNLGFVPGIIVACHRHYFVEAVVYLANMFFSAVYHWCDMSTWSKYLTCIAPYSSLQFCDFLCSILSFWVTLLAVAKMHPHLRFTLFITGLLAIMLPVHINHTGTINNAVLIAAGVSIVLTSWIVMCYRKRHMYPPCKQIVWFIPGAVLASAGLCVFVFAETTANYPYTHSVWHLCLSLSIVFLLPRVAVKVKDGSPSDSGSYELEDPPLMNCESASRSTDCDDSVNSTEASTLHDDAGRVNYTASNVTSETSLESVEQKQPDCVVAVDKLTDTATPPPTPGRAQPSVLVTESQDEDAKSENNSDDSHVASQSIQMTRTNSTASLITSSD